MIKSERLHMVPFEMTYLNDYFKGFNEEVTKYQWPDPFESIEDAGLTLQTFLDEMAREETLLFSILSQGEEFLGSVEVHWLAGDCPELGVWIIESAQNKGYAYEALNAVLDYLQASYDKAEFYYEADIRNTGSIRLLRKFGNKYEILEDGFQSLTTASGKRLELQGYVLKTK